MRRLAQPGKASALDGRKTLAHGVHLNDVGTAGEQLLGERVERIARNQRLFKQGRAAAGDEEQDRVVRRQAGHGADGLVGRGKRIVVGNGMPRFEDLQPRQIALAVTVLGDHDATGNAAAQLFDSGMRHLPGGLADGNEDQASRAEISAVKRFPYRSIRKGGCKSRPYDAIRIAA